MLPQSKLMSIDEELLLDIKTIDELDYAWKGDTRYINIVYFTVPRNSITQKYAKITNLWYFDFNATFDVYPNVYIIGVICSLQTVYNKYYIY